MMVVAAALVVIVVGSIRDEKRRIMIKGEQLVPSSELKQKTWIHFNVCVKRVDYSSTKTSNVLSRSAIIFKCFSPTIIVDKVPDPT